MIVWVILSIGFGVPRCRRHSDGCGDDGDDGGDVCCCCGSGGVRRRFRRVAIINPPPLRPALYLVYTDWIDVGWRRRCKSCLSLRELDSQRTVSFLLGGHHRWRSSNIVFVRGKPSLRSGGMVVSRSLYVVRHTHEAVTYSIKAICCIWNWPHQKLNQFIDAVIHTQENPPQKWFFVGSSSPCMRLAQHLTALRAW